jgi:hypothetical protein
MTIKITDALIGEHGPLYRQLDRLQEAASGSAAQMRSCAQLLAAGLASHAHLEDTLLFAAVEQRTGLDSMLEDMYTSIARSTRCSGSSLLQRTRMRRVRQRSAS